MSCNTTSSRPALAAIVLLAAGTLLSACAGGTAPQAMAPTSTPQQRSPLAAPPASMMTPHGY